MTMRTRAGSVLFTAAAAAAVVGLSVGPALASTTLTVRVSHGGSYTGTANKTTLTDPTKAAGNQSVTCVTTHHGRSPSSKASGRLSTGTYHGKANQAVALGAVKSLVFNNCSGPLGNVTNTVVGKPELNADSKTNSKGETAAIITKIKVNVAMSGCSFVVTGSAAGYYTNKTHTLTMTPKLPRGLKALAKAQLTIGSITGNCVVISSGDHPTFSASYVINLRKLSINSR